MGNRVILERKTINGVQRIIVQDKQEDSEWNMMLNETAWGVRRFFSAFFSSIIPGLVIGTIIMLAYVFFLASIVDKVLR